MLRENYRAGHRLLLLRYQRSSGSSTTVARRPRPCRAKGELAFGTIDTWLIWNMTNGRAVHATDYTNASRTTGVQYPSS